MGSCIFIMQSRRRAYRRKPYRSLVNRTGNFHMALPAQFRCRFKALDSNFRGIGAPPGIGGNDAGAPSASFTIIDTTNFSGLIFNPTPNTPAGVGVPAAGQYVVPGDSGGQNSFNLIPDQVLAFARLYKNARVERVDVTIKISNLGVSPLFGALAQTNSWSTIQGIQSASVNHTLLVLPRNQVAEMMSPASSGFKFNSGTNDALAMQLAEMPGSLMKQSSQDGNREQILLTKSIDLTTFYAGDSIRTSTWLTSSADSTSWNYSHSPETPLEDPRIVLLGTSPSLDQLLTTSGPAGSAQKDFWMRWNEAVTVQYHVTFWDQRTPRIIFNGA